MSATPCRNLVSFAINLLQFSHSSTIWAHWRFNEWPSWSASDFFPIFSNDLQPAWIYPLSFAVQVKSQLSHQGSFSSLRLLFSLNQKWRMFHGQESNFPLECNALIQRHKLSIYHFSRRMIYQRIYWYRTFHAQQSKAQFIFLETFRHKGLQRQWYNQHFPSRQYQQIFPIDWYRFIWSNKSSS